MKNRKSSKKNQFDWQFKVTVESYDSHRISATMPLLSVFIDAPVGYVKFYMIRDALFSQKAISMCLYSVFLLNDRIMVVLEISFTATFLFKRKLHKKGSILTEIF